MNNNSTHSKVYTAEDIQNYLEGRLTPLQMNAMEKAALDDPFLAEAMEGYAAVPQYDWKQPLADLQQSFAQKTAEAKIIPLKKNNNWWKAAAAVLIIGVASTLSYFLITKKPQQEIAKNTTPVTAPGNDAIVAKTDTAVNTDIATAGNITPLADEKKLYKTIIKDLTREPLQPVTDSNFVYKPSAADDALAVRKQAAAKDVEAAKTATSKETEFAKTAEKAAAPATAAVTPQQNGYNNSNNTNATIPENTPRNRVDYDAYKKEAKAAEGLTTRNEPALNKLFSAQVTGTDNTPLPFANVNIKTEDFGTYADVRGNFRLLSNDSVLTVEVRAAGFKPQTVTLRSNVQQNRVILTEDNNTLSEVVTSGNAAKSKALRRTAFVKDSAMNAEPADGWDNYNRYVDNNIEIPDDILKNNIHGQVEISFEVKANGAITNIKVDKSLCSNCDEAAIKLLQQGPQWKVKKGKKAKGKITVQF